MDQIKIGAFLKTLRKEKKCPVCRGKLKKQFTEEELKEIQKQNDDMAVINTLLM